jgi:hypothetical protein
MFQGPSMSDTRLSAQEIMQAIGFMKAYSDKAEIVFTYGEPIPKGTMVVMVESGKAPIIWGHIPTI